MVTRSRAPAAQRDPSAREAPSIRARRQGRSRALRARSLRGGRGEGETSWATSIDFSISQVGHKCCFGAGALPARNFGCVMSLHFQQQFLLLCSSSLCPALCQLTPNFTSSCLSLSHSPHSSLSTHSHCNPTGPSSPFSSTSALHLSLKPHPFLPQSLNPSPSCCCCLQSPHSQIPLPPQTHNPALPNPIFPLSPLIPSQSSSHFSKP